MNSHKVKAVNCHFTLRWSTTKNSNEGKMTPEIADGVCVELIQYMDCWRDEWMGSLFRCLMIHWLFVDSQNLWARQPTTVAVPMLSVSLFVTLTLMAHHHYNIILWKDRIAVFEVMVRVMVSVLVFTECLSYIFFTTDLLAAKLHRYIAVLLLITRSSGHYFDLLLTVS